MTKIDLKSDRIGWWNKRIICYQHKQGIIANKPSSEGDEECVFYISTYYRNMLSDIKGVLIYQDDVPVVIFAENKEALDKIFKAVRTRLSEKPVTVNEKTQLNIVQNCIFSGSRFLIARIRASWQIDS